MVGQPHGGAQNYLAQHGEDKPVVLEPDLGLMIGRFDQIEVGSRQLRSVDDAIN